MRKMLLGFAMLGAAMALDASPASARDYPFCIKGRDYPPGIGECSFPSYPACQTYAAGRYAYCDVNPFFHRAEGEPRRRSRRIVREVY